MAGKRKDAPPLSVAALRDIPESRTRRTACGIRELDALLGGGIVPGSAVLIGGEPGIGKSTLLMQLAGASSAQKARILYISAEESLSQVKMRATRLGIHQPDIFLASSGCLEDILDSVNRTEPALLIVDSIQTIHTTSINSAPGTLSQVRECASALIDVTKQKGIALFLAGHVTKEGSLAGPKTLEHMVDTVLYFEGSRDRELRLLRCFKNRFGNVDEVGVFLMRSKGLEEVRDPDGLFMEHSRETGPGAALTATLEGNRVLLAEVQALVTDCGANTPSRMIDGIEASRAMRIKAVIDRYTGCSIAARDVFMNIAGGLSIREPAVDLAIAIAMVSSFRNVPVERKAVFFGEVSLLGDVRRVPQCERRLLQAKKLGIPTAVLPEANRKEGEKVDGIEKIHIRTVSEALTLLG